MFTFWAPGFDALRCAKQHNMLQNFLKTFSVLLCKQHLVDLTKLISLSVPEIRDPKLIWAIIQAKCLLMSKCIGKLCFTDFIPQRARSGTNSPAWGFTVGLRSSTVPQWTWTWAWAPLSWHEQLRRCLHGNVQGGPCVGMWQEGSLQTQHGCSALHVKLLWMIETLNLMSLSQTHTR